MDLDAHVRLVESQMRTLLVPSEPALQPFYGMMSYHLGWLDAQFRPIQADGGKRLRPLICLLACEALGGDIQRALPAAAGIELLHNFSLIHDDIQDNSPMRRHRETVWHLWGMPQAINAGDGMLILAHLALQPLQERGVPPATVVQTLRVLDQTCFRLCQGQYLDIAFEQREAVDVEEYLRMIGGKTASLIAASAEIGAMLATDGSQAIAASREFGWELGLAFQMVDDILGIWGDPQVTGKSAASDILSRKKTLPILFALQHLPASSAAAFGRVYAQERLAEEDVPQILGWLEQAGARADVIQRAELHTQRALAALDRTGGSGPAQEQLRALAQSFLKRSF